MTFLMGGFEQGSLAYLAHTRPFPSRGCCAVLTSSLGHEVAGKAVAPSHAPPGQGVVSPQAIWRMAGKSLQASGGKQDP